MINRNDLCWCGSGKKIKKCKCLDKKKEERKEKISEYGEELLQKHTNRKNRFKML